MLALEGNRPAPADGQVATAARGHWTMGEDERVALHSATRYATLDSGYAVESGSGRESAYISEASKRAVLVDMKNAD